MITAMKITQDLHIHTNLSSCAKNEATPKACLEAAQKQGLKTVGFADHCWAAQLPGASEWYKKQDMEHVLKIREMLPADTGEMRVLIGCETEYTGNGIAGLNKELAGAFDFVLIPANHFHMKGYTVPENLASGGPQAVSQLLYRRFMEVTELGFGAGIAHPFRPLGFIEWEEDILKGITGIQYEQCFRNAASAGLAIEISIWSVDREVCLAPDGFSSLYLEMYTIAHECGCKFYFASDAHHPDEITGYDRMLKFAQLCGIDESSCLNY